MDIDNDPLGPIQYGRPGMASLVDRLEREALAEQRELEQAEAAKANGSNGSRSRAQDDIDENTYVPGAKRQKTSIAPNSSSSTGGGHQKDATDNVNATSSTSNAQHTNGTATVNASGSNGDASAAAASNGAPGSTSSAKPDANQTTESKEKEKKKARPVQETVRLVFGWPPYKSSTEIPAKDVPIFHVRREAEKRGLLLPEVPVSEDESSSGGSDDDEDGHDDDDDGDEPQTDAPTKEATPPPEMTAAQKELAAATALAAKSKLTQLLKKRKPLERDEGYNVDDPFVDDSELRINEPRVFARPKVDGYIALTGRVATWADEEDNKPKRGRKFGSINKPKVPVVQPDGSTKFVSEAIAAKEAKKKERESKGKESEKEGSARPTEASSASPAPSTSRVKPNGPLLSRDTVAYSHLPSSSRAYSPTEEPPRVSPLPSYASPPPNSHRSSSQFLDTPRLAAAGQGSHMSPIELDDEDDKIPPRPASSSPDKSTPAPASRSSAHVVTFEPSPSKGGKKEYEVHAIRSTKLSQALENLKMEADKESFVPKNKFPPRLKPLLLNVALLAIREGEYDDNFFNMMPQIFPYNRFTMNKMIKREVCEPRIKELNHDIDGLTIEFKHAVEADMPEQERRYEEQMQVWREKRAEWEKTHPADSGTAEEHSTPAPSTHGRAMSLTPVPSDADTSSAQPAAAADAGPPQPVRKFKFNDAPRMLLFRIMYNNTEIFERLRDKSLVEKPHPATCKCVDRLNGCKEQDNPGDIPSQTMLVRKRYAELVKFWPEGWMTTNQLSRELTAAKKKIEKQLEKK